MCIRDSLSTAYKNSFPRQVQVTRFKVRQRMRTERQRGSNFELICGLVWQSILVIEHMNPTVFTELQLFNS